MSNEIGNKLRLLRKEKRMTQEELSEMLGGDPSRSTLSNYEVGRRSPHIKDLQRLSSALGVGLDYFGVAPHDEAFDLLARAREVFTSDEVSYETKERLYMEFMRLYLEFRRAHNEQNQN